MAIRTLADIIEVEKVPIWERIREQTIYERLTIAAELKPDHLAIRALLTGEIDEVPRDITYREFLAKTTQAANLFTSLGVGCTDVVSLLVQLTPESMFSLCGAMAVGVANPLNPMISPIFLADVLRETAATVLVVSSECLTPEFLSQLSAHRATLPNLKTMIRLGGNGDPPLGVLDFERAIAEKPADRLIARPTATRDTIAAMFHTGGTTGKPKLARLTNGGLLVATWVLALVTPNQADDVTFLGLPLFHAAGAIVLGMSWLARGRTIVLLTPAGLRNPVVLRNYWALVERLQATYIGAVPTSMAALLNLSGGMVPGSKVRCFMSGAAALPIELAKRFSAHFGLTVVEAYGLTELHGCAAFNPWDGECRYGSVGLRLPYLELVIAEVSPSGDIVRCCGVDEIGHVLMRGPLTFPGYLNPDDNRGVMLADGWLDSGDLGRLDADDYLWLTGRAKDLIIRGGHNIDPQPIDQALSRHPAVELAAAVGRPDRHAGELPVAFVQLRLRALASPEELREFCRSQIADPAAVPVEIFMVPALPLTAVGKIHKPTLRKEAARQVFEREVAKLAAEGVKARAAIVDDPRHGTVVQILVEDSGRWQPADLAELCRTLLGGYQLRHEVVTPAS